ncbi:hypothetical protein HMPREF0239_03765 [Clostridium sp. ATCC BAA-442]|nr:hypothetical protein HMPREF0239_03765 [Clostridium sp. ATCC BAA-442]
MKDNPDGFLSHYLSLRILPLEGLSAVCGGYLPGIRRPYA